MKNLEINNVLADIHNIISHRAGLIKKVGVFGSLARGNFHDDSDIDILIEYNSTPELQMEHFTQFCELCGNLRDILFDIYGRKIDIVHFEDDPARNLQDENVINEVIWI